MFNPRCHYGRYTRCFLCQKKFGDSSCNRMKVIGNIFKIQDGGLPPYWFLVFTVYSVNYRKSNSEEIKSNLVIQTATEWKELAI